MLKKIKNIVVPLILLFLFCVLIFSAKSESRVFDEKTQVNAGYQFLVNKDFRYDPFNPPFARELIALPILLDKNLLNDNSLFLPRLVTILFTLGLGYLIFIFSKKLYGLYAGLLALLIFSIEPNILANGHYAESDLIFT
jgi:hypothetical protein